MFLSNRNSLENNTKENHGRFTRNEISSMRSTFSNDFKYIECVLKRDEELEIQNCQEKDLRFVKDLIEIEEHTQNVVQKKQAKKQHMTEQIYQNVEDTGAIHYAANIFNDSCEDLENVVQENKCPCGCKKSKGNKLPYCINIEKKYFFGEGIILFFYFNTRTLLLMVPILLIYGIYSLVTNLIYEQSSETCLKPGALAFMCQFKISSQIQNKKYHDTLNIVQLCLGLLMCFAWSLGMRLIRRFGFKKGQKIDEMLISASDYFIFIEKLHIGDYSEHDILLYLKKLWQAIEDPQKGELKIKAVQIIYDMEEFRKKIDEFRKTVKRMLLFLNDEQRQRLKQGKQIEDLTSIKIKSKFESTYKEDRKRIIELYRQLLEYREKFKEDLDFRKKLASECALVEFVDEKQKKIFLEKYGVLRVTWAQNKIQRLKRMIWKETPSTLFKHREIRISQSPEPSDIFWKHCQKKARMRRTIIVWVIVLFCTGGTLGVLILMRWAIIQNPSIPILSIIGIVIVNLFNRGIWLLLLKIIFIEKNYTKTINLISVMNKSYVSQIINIILAPILLNLVLFDHNLHGPNGLAGQTHDFQITAFLFMILFNLINAPHRIFQLFRCIKPIRRKIIRRYTRGHRQINTYEGIRQAVSKVYGPPNLPVAGIYVYITAIITQAFFFCHLNPILLFYLLGNLFFFFLINQYIVIKMYKVPDMIAITVFHHAITLALNVPFLYGVSSILFLTLSQNEAYHFGYYIPSIFCFVIWFLSIQSPFKLYRKLIDWIINKFFPQLIKEDEAIDQKNRDEKIYFEYGNQNISSADRLPDLAGISKRNSQRESKDRKFQGRTRRVESYFEPLGANEIFDLQSLLKEGRGPEHGSMQAFCQQFNTCRMNILYNEQK